MNIGTENSDSVEYQIIVEASQAIKEIAELKKSASSVAESIDVIGKGIENFALKTGLSTKAVKALFDDVQKQGAQLRDMLNDPKFAGLDKIINRSPLMSQIAETPTLNDLGSAQNALINDLLNERLRLQRALAKESLNEISSEQKIAAERQKNLNLANQELAAVEKEGVALQQQLKSYGQISRTTDRVLDCEGFSSIKAHLI